MEHRTRDKLLSNFNNLHRWLFYLLLLLIPTQLGYHFWPDFAFVNGIRVDYLAPTIYLTDLLILGIGISWLLSKITNDDLPARNASRNMRDAGGSNSETMQTIGLIGQINDSILVDIDFDMLIRYASTKKSYTPIPEHPPVIEDMTLTIKPSTHIGPVMDTIKTASTLVKEVTLTSQYEDKLTFRITFQDPKKNLSDKEVGEIKELIKAKLQI